MTQHDTLNRRHTDTMRFNAVIHKAASRLAQAWLGGLVAVSISSLMACQASPNSRMLRSPLLSITGQLRSIEQVTQPDQVGQTVYLRGTVGDRVPLVNGQAYELIDATGTLWVVSDNRTVTTGESMIVKGRVAYEATPEFGDGVGEIYLWEVGKRSP